MNCTYPTRKDQVLAAIRHEPLTAVEIGKLLKVEAYTVRTYTRMLEKSGDIRHVKVVTNASGAGQHLFYYPGESMGRIESAIARTTASGSRPGQIGVKPARNQGARNPIVTVVAAGESDDWSEVP